MLHINRVSFLLFTLAVLGVCSSASAAEDIRDLHRRVAREMVQTIRSGAVLRGTVDQNGSPGQFEAYFFDGNYLIRESFGTLTSMSYRGPDGAYSGSNYSLPYKLDPKDSPASAALGLISSGDYLDDPNWQYFTYVGEEAGGYRFRFAPEGLPPVDVLLYNDADDPEYLQVLSTEVALAPQDAESIRHRSFYYYGTDAAGRIYTNRETGRELDHRGLTVNQSEYTVTEFTAATERPAGLSFDTARKPVGGAGADLTAPVTIPVDTSFGYFLVPVTFADGTTLNFILDTGASASLFAPNAVAASGIETSVVTTAHGHGTRQEFELGMVSGASIGTADGVKVPLMPFPATKIPSASRDVLEAMASYNCSGILGVAPLHQYVVTLDHAGKSMTFTPQQLFDPATSLAGGALTYTLDAEDLIYVTARINDRMIGPMALDTGLQHDMALLRETMEIAGEKFEKVGQSANIVIGGQKDFDFVSVPSFDLGPLRLEGKIATLTEDDRGSMVARGLLGFIGLSLFTQARVTLDLFEQRMYVQPPAQLLESMRATSPELFNQVVDSLYITPGVADKPLVPFGGPPAREESAPAASTEDAEAAQA